MKITANRRDDIIRRRDEFDSRRSSRKSQFDKREESYWKDKRVVLQAIETELFEYTLERFKSLEFDVDADQRWGGGLGVRVRCNEHNKFSETSALSWSFDVYLDESGNVVKETGSWSGLKACTEEQLNSLEESVDCLKLLNRIDWPKFLNRAVPDYQSYFEDDDFSDLREPRPNFERELKEAEVDECVGERKLIVDKDNLLWGISSSTPKFYQVFSLPHTRDIEQSFVDEGRITWDDLVNKSSKYLDKVSKDKFLKNIPSEVEIIEY